MGRESLKLGERRREGTYHTGVQKLSRVLFWESTENPSTHCHIRPPPLQTAPSQKINQKGNPQMTRSVKAIPAAHYPVPDSKSTLEFIKTKSSIVIHNLS